MRTIGFEQCFVVSPGFIISTHLALIRIGMKNPHNIKKLSNKRRIEPAMPLNDNEYLKLGILNLRITLNGTNGKNGKFSIRAIRRIITVTRKRHNAAHLAVRTPDKTEDWKKIISTIYDMLYAVDSQYIQFLLSMEQNDIFIPRAHSQSDKIKAIMPVQTTVVIAGVPKGQKGKGFKEYARKLNEGGW